MTRDDPEHIPEHVRHAVPAAGEPGATGVDWMAQTQDAAVSVDDWEAAYETGDVPETPVDRDVIAVARERTPGTALDLGCGAGQNSVWLAEHGWDVLGVDIAGGAIARAELAARRAGLAVRYERQDLTTWRTTERFDLVISTYALPPRGPGRTHALATARDAVAPGGTALIAEFEISLASAGWMAEAHLVSLDEITAMFPGFHLDRAEVQVVKHSHGEARDVPVVIVIARHPGPVSDPPSALRG